MKILALHLPAFHEIPENNLWWGDGFTEWDNVKKGKPLYKGHIQPLVPYDDNYYDLSNNKVLENQFNMASTYNLDGFIFYHYWFKGHKLFEKPIEDLLKNTKITNEFCLCWANETWSRTREGKNQDILIKQEYGSELDWKEHIKYLYQFFSDPRYIKKDGRPVFFVYSVNQISNFDRMLKVWNDFLKERGLKSIFLIEFLRAKNAKPGSADSDGVIEFEPMFTIRYDLNLLEKGKRYFCKRMNLIDFQNYDKVWRKILTRKAEYGNKTIYKSCFVAWDNSPRKGRKNSIILKGSSPEKFGNYFYNLLCLKRKKCSNDFVIINAWNEWGEGAILEPSKQFGFRYLEQLSKAINKFKCED